MAQYALYGLLGFFAVFILIHIAILSGLLPFTIVWGSRVKSKRQMIRLEVIAIVVLSILSLIAAGAAGFLPLSMPHLFYQISLWVMAGLFFLNTIGNLLSENAFEKWVFGACTVAMTILSGFSAWNL